MKVMISQPMSGKTTEQIKSEREELVKELKKQGYEVIDTIFTEEAPKDCDTAMYYLAKSIEAMSKADAVIFMEDWHRARGCIVEHEVATYYNKFIKDLNNRF